MKKYIWNIGISKYISAEYDNLPNAELDSKKIFNIFNQAYGFEAYGNSLYNEEATRKNILEIFDGMSETIQKHDTLVIYFSGHGEINYKTKNGYWVPHDSDSSISTLISNSEIIDLIQAIDAKHILLISDSCFSGTFITRTRAGIKYEENILEYSRKKSRYILTSAIETTVSDGVASKGSPFSIAMCNYLTDSSNSRFLANELFINIQEYILHNSNQQSIFSEIKGCGHAGGMILFEKESNIVNYNLDSDNTIDISNNTEVSRVKVTKKVKPTSQIINEHSTIFFNDRVIEGFPGFYGFKWFDDPKTIVKRFDIVFRDPIGFEPSENRKFDATPIWWWRGSSALPIRRMRKLSATKVLMGNEELEISRVGVFRSSSYYESFIYVEVKGEDQIGVNNIDDESIKYWIDEFGYRDEFYGLHNGIAIKYQEYCDGAALINGEVVNCMDAESRRRFLTPYNFIIAAKRSPYNCREFCKMSNKYFASLLKNEIDFEKDFLPELNKLEKRDY